MVFSILRAPVVQKATGLPKSSFYWNILSRGTGARTHRDT